MVTARLNELNRLYSDVIEEALQALPELTPDLGYHQMLMLAKGLGTLVVPTEDGWSTSFGQRLRKVRDDIGHFWRTHDAEYMELSRSLPGIGVYSNPPPHPSYLLYFDYIAMDDLMLAIPNHLEDWKNSIFLGGALNSLRSQLPLLRAASEEEMPAILLLPPPPTIGTCLPTVTLSHR